MKKVILLTLLVVAGTMILWSQVPQAMNYKAVAKDDWGVALPNKTISLRFTILQGSETGAIVYQETHLTATNKFGLMDVEIGKGTPVIGAFDMIDWSTGVYYIQIEMDPNGGTSFRLEDPAHQLLSVPYAMYAGSSGNSVFSETDPVFSSSPSYSILNSEIFNWNTAFGWGNHAGLYRPITYFPTWSEITGKPFIITTPSNGQLLKYDGTNWINYTPDYLTSVTELDPAFTTNFDFTGAVIDDLLKFNGSKWVKFTPNFALTNHTHSDATTLKSGFMSGTDKTKLDGIQNADGSETKVTAGTNITVTGVGTEASPYVIRSTGGGSGHYIGEIYGGGIVFYVYDNGLHGLIAATADQSTGIRWWAGTYAYTMAKAKGVGAGKANTAIIIANQGIGDGLNYAARICNEYSVTVDGVTYGDWYLPSIYELYLLSLQKSVVGAGNYEYWSSTESSEDRAYTRDFALNSEVDMYRHKSYTLYVRAIRAF